MTDWDLLMPGIGLTALGIAGVGLSLAGIAATFLEGMHAVSLLAMFIGLIFLVQGLFKDGFPSSPRAKSATFIVLGFLVTFGIAAANNGECPSSKHLCIHCTDDDNFYSCINSCTSIVQEDTISQESRNYSYWRCNSGRFHVLCFGSGGSKVFCSGWTKWDRQYCSQRHRYKCNIIKRSTYNEGNYFTRCFCQR